MIEPHSGSLVTFAPARVDLSPGFTDVEPLCLEVPGQIVNVTLDLGVEVTVRDGIDRRGPTSFVDTLCGAVARRLAIESPHVRLSVPSLPSGSGLGMSGALSVALAYALSLKAGASTNPLELADLACAAERDTGLTGGTQDQLASVYGGAGVVHRHGGLGSREPLEADLAALRSRLVLVYGSGSRNSGSIIEHVLYERPRAEVLQIISAMNEVSATVARSLGDGDYELLAEAMNESTALLRGLHVDIADKEFDNRLRTLGASAVKPCGAGGSGAVWMALVDPTLRATFVATVVADGLSVLPAAPSVTAARRVQAA